jgi:hypothetical protein
MLVMGCNVLEAMTGGLACGQCDEALRDFHTANTYPEDLQAECPGDAGKEGNPCGTIFTVVIHSEHGLNRGVRGSAGSSP